MKKIFYLLGVALLASQCATESIELSGTDYSNDVELQTSQTNTTEARSLERVDGSLFVVEYGKRYSVEPDVITVKYKPELKESAQKVSEIRSNLLGYIDIRVPEGVDVEEYVHELEKSGEFASVEYNTYGEWGYSPNDTRIGEQWYLNTINAYQAWDITAGTSSVKVAIIDSGVDVNHPDLGVGADGYSSVDASLGWNYITNSSNVVTSNGHGTRVAGIVAAKTNNSGRGIAGVAGGKGNRGITMIPYCVGISVPNFSVVDDAIYDAVSKGARVIQLSLGGASSSAITSAINYATQNNVVVVCCSMNDNSSVSFPASLNNVIAVGATNKNGSRVAFSNYGSALDVVAPGVDILSTTLNGGYNSQDGTSFAAPHVSGIAALILSINPNLSQAQVVQAIERSGSLYPSRTNELGYGLVDAHEAVSKAAGLAFGISGSSFLQLNTNMTFSVRADRPAGTTFNGWSINPQTGYTVTGGTTGNTLNVRFTTKDRYIISASYTMPGGASFSTRHMVVFAPTIGSYYIPGTVLSHGQSVIFFVDTPYPISPGVSLMEWSASGNVFATGVTMMSVSFSPPFNSSSSNYSIRCRMREYTTGDWTDWSEPIVVTYQ